MKYRHDSEYDKEKKFRRVSRSKDQKYRKIPLEYFDEEDLDDDFDDDVTVDLDTQT